MKWLAALLVVLVSIGTYFLGVAVRDNGFEWKSVVQQSSRWTVIRSSEIADDVQTVHYSLYYNLGSQSPEDFEVIAETSDHTEATNVANRQAERELERYRSGEISLPEGIRQVIVFGSTSQVGYYKP